MLGLSLELTVVTIWTKSTLRLSRQACATAVCTRGTRELVRKFSSYRTIVATRTNGALAGVCTVAILSSRAVITIRLLSQWLIFSGWADYLVLGTGGTHVTFSARHGCRSCWLRITIESSSTVICSSAWDGRQSYRIAEDTWWASNTSSDVSGSLTWPIGSNWTSSWNDWTRWTVFSSRAEILIWILWASIWTVVTTTALTTYLWHFIVLTEETLITWRWCDASNSTILTRNAHSSKLVWNWIRNTSLCAYTANRTWTVKSLSTRTDDIWCLAGFTSCASSAVSSIRGACQSAHECTLGTWSHNIVVACISVETSCLCWCSSACFPSRTNCASSFARTICIKTGLASRCTKLACLHSGSTSGTIVVLVASCLGGWRATSSAVVTGTTISGGILHRSNVAVFAVRAWYAFCLRLCTQIWNKSTWLALRWSWRLLATKLTIWTNITSSVVCPCILSWENTVWSGRSWPAWTIVTSSTLFRIIESKRKQIVAVVATITGCCSGASCSTVSACWADIALASYKFSVWCVAINRSAQRWACSAIEALIAWPTCLGLSVAFTELAYMKLL